MEEKLKLRYWRNVRALTVRQLAEKAGVTTYTITKIENHGHIPTNTVITKLANALGVEPKELYREDIDLSKVGKNLRLPALNGQAEQIVTRVAPLVTIS